MLNKYMLGILLMTLLGCQQPNIETSKEPINTKPNHEKTATLSTQQIPNDQHNPSVFVAHLEKLEEVGDAAFYTGILNEKNGCLYIDDRLVLVTGIYVKWQNEPFWIGNNHGEKFKLGDTVSVGGSEAKYTKDFIDDINNPNCVADKVWLTLNINKPFM